MPFKPLETVAAQAKDVMASISYRRNMTKHGRSRSPKLIIGIPKTAMADFKPKPTQLFALMLGEVADAGKARIVPAASGVKATVLKGGAVFRFGYVPLLGNDAADKEFVDVKAVGGGFEISLPAWFKAD